MKPKSDPREWYRQEELACEKARRKMQSGRRAHLMPVYVAAALVAAGAIYLLLIVAGKLEPAWAP